MALWTAPVVTPASDDDRTDDVEDQATEADGPTKPYEGYRRGSGEFLYALRAACSKAAASR